MRSTVAIWSTSYLQGNKDTASISLMIPFQLPSQLSCDITQFFNFRQVEVFLKIFILEVTLLRWSHRKMLFWR